MACSASWKVRKQIIINPHGTCAASFKGGMNTPPSCLRLRFFSRGRLALDIKPYFCNYRNMATQSRKVLDRIPKYADMLSAMGAEARLRIMHLLLSAHPDGLVVGDIQEELDIPNSTLSHHLDKLRNEDLVRVQRESTFLRYSANTESLQELLSFLYSECCTRNQAVNPETIVQISR